MTNTTKTLTAARTTDAAAAELAAKGDLIGACIKLRTAAALFRSAGSHDKAEECELTAYAWRALAA